MFGLNGSVADITFGHFMTLDRLAGGIRKRKSIRQLKPVSCRVLVCHRADGSSTGLGIATSLSEFWRAGSSSAASRTG
jgi:hypothetical protein